MNSLINNFTLIIICIFFMKCNSHPEMNKEIVHFDPPVSFEKAGEWADSIVSAMTLEEKINFIGGDRIFFTNAIPRLNIPAIEMSDATQGLRLLKTFEYDGVKYEYEDILPKSTAFPSPILLASTWNTALSKSYAHALGEECRAGGIPVLLGPGMNIYRISQCGRNFEYFGEDPFLAARMIENYVVGLQNTGTIATLKHFVANNSDFYRKRSNSVVDERTLNEVYAYAFKSGIDAGAMAVMTAYNQVNGEWCGQSNEIITNLLRKKLGFKWMVMTDWWSVYDGKSLIKSGQDIEMPNRIATANADELIQNGDIKEADLDRMVKSLLRTLYAMDAFNRKPNKDLLKKYAEHEEVALKTAREGIVLLRNENNILPLQGGNSKILLTGDNIDTIGTGGGSAFVEGFNQITIGEALTNEFGDQLMIINDPSDDTIKMADIVIYCVATADSEGSDRPFELPEEKESGILKTARLNPNTIVIVNSGSGINMSAWNEKVKAILYTWYFGQNGAKAIGEILSGKVNPSGKLPITIEKDFSDSPGYGYIPEGDSLYEGWADDSKRDVFDVNYNEGVFVGYRWYEKKKIEPLYPFGFGLSYTSFKYSEIKTSMTTVGPDDTFEITFSLKNTGSLPGAEIVELYVEDVESSLPRPIKELKGFKKIPLIPGKEIRVGILLNKDDLSFYHPEKGGWVAEPGKFRIYIGSSSVDLPLVKEIEYKEIAD